MKLSNRTLTILKNFSGINSSINVEKGNVISTVSRGKNILASATIQDSFDKDFAIYELSRFISALSLFNEPNLEFGEKSVKIFDNKKQEINYIYCDPDFILWPTKEQIEKVKDIEGIVEFNLSSEMIQSLLKVSSVLKLNNICIVGDGENIKIKSTQINNNTSDDFSIEIGETDKKFNIVFDTENFKMLPQSYKVKINNRLAEFKGDDIIYWVAIEKDLSEI